MDIKELMIGDLLSHNGIPVEIVSINSQDNDIVVRDTDDNKLLITVGFEDVMIAPIPLTKNILDKNLDKCEKVSCGYYSFTGKDKNVNICINEYWEIVVAEISEDEDISVRFRPQYVHELQHLLRLCKISSKLNV